MYIYTFVYICEDAVAGAPHDPAERQPRGCEAWWGVHREFLIDSLLVRIHFIVVRLGGPASRHGSLYFLFQVALNLLSSVGGQLGCRV